MCAEVMICQSDSFPQRLMISQTPSIGETLISPQVGAGMYRKLSQLLGEFCKILPSQNSIFKTLQNWGMSGLPHFCTFQYYSYGSE